MRSMKIFLGALAFLTIIILSGSVFIVEQTHQALVLQFGELRRVVTEPGLHFKIPFIQDVTFYEKRILDCDMTEVAITTGDQKRLMVDAYVRYRISDAILFYRSVRPADEIGASIQLQTIAASTLRIVLGKVKLRDLLSEKRAAIMRQINDDVKNGAKSSGIEINGAKSMGIEIIDVRIKRTELPEKNREAVYRKMNSELEKIAKQTRAEGAQQAQEIRATTDKECTVIIATAHQKAQENRGEGEAKSLAIISEKVGKDPEFYGFFRSLDIFKTSLAENGTLVLSTNSELFKYFQSPDQVMKHTTKENNN